MLVAIENHTCIKICLAKAASSPVPIETLGIDPISKPVAYYIGLTRYPHGGIAPRPRPGPSHFLAEP